MEDNKEILTKRCTKCQEEKALDQFYMRSDVKGKYKSRCKYCYNEQYKEYHQNTKDDRAKTAKQWYQNNKQHKNDMTKKWYLLNKEHADMVRKNWSLANQDYLRDYRAEYQRHYQYHRYHNDISFKLAHNIRSRLTYLIKAESGSAVDDLGCSLEELKIYLESKFQVGMTWDNWSKDGWHIDHITPLSSFDLTNPDQFKKACHYTNLQPLWAKDNLSKGDKILLTQTDNIDLYDNDCSFINAED